MEVYETSCIDAAAVCVMNEFLARGKMRTAIYNIHQSGNQWRNQGRGNRVGQVPPGAAGEGAQNILAKNISWLMPSNRK